MGNPGSVSSLQLAVNGEHSVSLRGSITLRPSSVWPPNRPSFATMARYTTIFRGFTSIFQARVRLSFISLSPHLDEPRRSDNERLLSSAHVSAAFLPWHRQYIHLYEKALKEECAFDSDLP